MKKLSLIDRLLCWFRGIQPEYFSRDTNERAYLWTQCMALTLPVALAGFNGWLMGREAGCDPPVALLCAVGVGFLVYAVERALLRIVAGAGRHLWLGIAARAVIALCLALLLGEGISSRLIFPDSVAAYYAAMSEGEIQVAREERDTEIDRAGKERTAALLPFAGAVAQAKERLRLANVERVEAQKRELEMQEILFEEEEGQAASRAQNRGSRFAAKEQTYHAPAVRRLEKAKASLSEAETILDTSTKAYERAIADQKAYQDALQSAEREFQRKSEAAVSQHHRDLGSRIVAMVRIAAEEPFVAVGWAISSLFLVAVDLLMLLVATCGRPTSFDLEETQEHRVRVTRFEAIADKIAEKEKFVANIRAETEIRTEIVQSSLEESLFMIRKMTEYLNTVNAARATVAAQRDEAEAEGNVEFAQICRTTLASLDYWAERGFKKVSQGMSA